MKLKEFMEFEKKKIDSIIEKYFPRMFGKYDIDRIFGAPKYAYNEKEIRRALIEPFWNFMDRGGKRIRPILFLLVAKSLGVNVDEYKELVILLELLHNGSIIVDDIEDNSDLRRGKPTLHKIYGIDIAINVGNFLYFASFLPIIEKLKRFDEDTIKRMFKAIIEELMRIHVGQGIDIVWHKQMFDVKHINEKKYMQMCSYKTGVLMRLATRLAAILAKKTEDEERLLGAFGESIGVAFQIQDDILNIVPSDKWGKDVGDDISEGKITLLILKAIENLEKDKANRLIDIIKMRTKEKKIIEEAINLIVKSGAINYAKNTAKNIVKNSWKDVKDMFIDCKEKYILEELVNYIVERDY